MSAPSSTAAKLSGKREFDRVLTDGRSVAGRMMVVYYSPRAAGSRVGLVVSRRIGGAVIRNRVKRLLREATRAVFPLLKRPVDVVIIARQPTAGARSGEVKEALVESLIRAGLLDGDAPRRMQGVPRR